VSALRDGRRTITLDASGTVSGVPEEARARVATLLRMPKLTIASVADLAAPIAGDALRGSDVRQTLAVRSPRAIVVLDDRPEFRWQGAAGARFQVTVTDLSLNVIDASGPLDTMRWTPPRPLPRGATLLWQVRSTGSEQAIAPAPPAPPARFRIVDAAGVARIEEARRLDSHLLLAAAYGEAGMREEAKGELQLLASENLDSPIAAQLLESVSER
jgi:hypothetical protein